MIYGDKKNGKNFLFNVKILRFTDVLLTFYIYQILIVALLVRLWVTDDQILLRKSGILYITEKGVLVCW